MTSLPSTNAGTEHKARSHFVVLACVWLTTALYLLPFVDRGWIPSDEGLLAQSAERVLAGELPHRDFADMYTGGQALLHAGVMHVLGLRLISLRWWLYLATLLALPLVYRIAAQVAQPLVAGAVTLTCVVWTLPNYFAAMPSWYNLFLSLGAVLSLLRSIETGRPRWLFVAGLCAGLSFLVKSAALLLIAAVFLGFLYREQELDQQSAPERRRLAFPLFVTAGLGLFLFILTAFVAQKGRPAEFLLFVGPSACLCGVILAAAWAPRPSGTFRVRSMRLVAQAAPFLAGALVPCIAFIVAYWQAGALTSLAAGDFLFAEKRLHFTTYRLPGIETVVCALPILALLVWPLWRPVTKATERRLLWPVILAGCLVVACGSQLYVYQTVWFSARPLVLMVVLAGSLLLIRQTPQPTVGSSRRQALFLLLAVAAVTSISQFPFSWGIYFCYIAPLLILAALYLVRTQPGAPQKLHLAVLGAYALFAILWINLGWIESHSWFFQHRQLDTRLAIERGGLMVTAHESASYSALIEEVRLHSPEGAFIYASPDCPEVYFLTNRRNPTRAFYDYFEDDYQSPARSARLLRLLEDNAIDVVVLHWLPPFSVLPPGFAQAVFDRFPHSTPIPPRFTVHWRESRRPP